MVCTEKKTNRKSTRMPMVKKENSQIRDWHLTHSAHPIALLHILNVPQSPSFFNLSPTCSRERDQLLPFWGDSLVIRPYFTTRVSSRELREGAQVIFIYVKSHHMHLNSNSLHFPFDMKVISYKFNHFNRNWDKYKRYIAYNTISTVVFTALCTVSE